MPLGLDTNRTGSPAVEQLDLGGAAGHEQVNDPFGAGLEMKLRQGTPLRMQLLRGRGPQLFVQQRGQSERADATAGVMEELAPGQGLARFQQQVHRPYLLVMVSSRFKATLAIAVQAASSQGSRSVGPAASPVASSCRAAPRPV